MNFAMDLEGTHALRVQLCVFTIDVPSSRGLGFNNSIGKGSSTIKFVWRFAIEVFVLASRLTPSLATLN
jgi:hypothetical protein